MRLGYVLSTRHSSLKQEYANSAKLLSSAKLLLNREKVTSRWKDAEGRLSLSLISSDIFGKRRVAVEPAWSIDNGSTVSNTDTNYSTTEWCTPNVEAEHDNVIDEWPGRRPEYYDIWNRW